MWRSLTIRAPPALRMQVMLPESRDSLSVVDLAEQAAAAGDYVSAEQFLREAVRLREAESGPNSPDLANTLNNLGVVSEMQNNADEAEICYRKAYAIAAATLPPDHPFVATSRKNLSDLCAARGKPIDVESRPPESPAVERAAKAPPVPSRPVSPKAARFPLVTNARTLAIAALLLAGVLFVILATIRGRPASTGELVRSPTISPLQKPEPPTTPEQVAVKPSATVRAPAPAKREAKPPAASAPAAPAVITARLCRTLNRSSSASDDWSCEAATGQVSAGTLFFYTRLKAARKTEVQHRWYHDDTLYQSVDLEIGANQIRGFRTFSRYTIKIGSSGNWRVELRSSDGTLLHQQRFTVR